MDYSISLNGIYSAQRTLEQSARRIASPDPSTDYVSELLAVRQARTAEEANLRVVSTQMKLEGALLDLFA